MPSLATMAFAYMVMAEHIEKRVAEMNTQILRDPAEIDALEHEAVHARGLVMVIQQQMTVDDMGLNQFSAPQPTPSIWPAGSRRP